MHGFVGVDGLFDPARTLRVIEDLDADLVALQEVHATPHARRGLDGLAERTGYRVLLGPTLQRGGADFGNALLTRLTVEEFRRHDLTVASEPRAALEARLRLDTTLLHVVVVHLGLRAAERRVQISRLVERLRESTTATEPSLSVVLGDLNEWGSARRLAPLVQSVGPFSRRATYPSRLPVLPLDRIAVRPARALLEVRAVQSALTRAASDHLPLCARLRVPG